MAKGRKPVVAPTSDEILAYTPVGMRVKNGEAKKSKERHCYGVMATVEGMPPVTLATGLNKSAAQACEHIVRMFNNAGDTVYSNAVVIDEGTVASYRTARGLDTQEGD
jgi:hypothetical protein